MDRPTSPSIGCNLVRCVQERNLGPPSALTNLVTKGHQEYLMATIKHYFHNHTGARALTTIDVDGVKVQAQYWGRWRFSEERSEEID